MAVDLDRDVAVSSFGDHFDPVLRDDKVEVHAGPGRPELAPCPAIVLEFVDFALAGHDVRMLEICGRFAVSGPGHQDQMIAGVDFDFVAAIGSIDDPLAIDFAH